MDGISMGNLFENDSFNKMCNDLYNERTFLNDKTKNGCCSCCGECCSNWLPISEKEYLEIERYITKHKILGYRNMLDLSWHDKCPFLDEHRRCRVYTVRPLICREFKCDLQKKSGIDFTKFLGEERKLVSMWDLFYEGF